MKEIESSTNYTRHNQGAAVKLSVPLQPTLRPNLDAYLIVRLIVDSAAVSAAFKTPKTAYGALNVPAGKMTTIDTTTEQ